MTVKRKAIAILLLLGYGCGAARSQTDSSRAPVAAQPVWAANNFLSSITLPTNGLQLFNFRNGNLIETLLDSADLLIEEARQHLGKPYRYGGKGPKAFDCAGFARYVYMKFGFTLPGGSVPQSRLGRSITDRKKLQRGDLVFFQGRSGTGGVGHTGIVTEVDTSTGVFRFIHAATSTGVIYSYSTEPYYAKRYLCARRLLGDRKTVDALPRRKRR
ncbi:MAG: C40 family peptidase [Bacteroidales bacterium]|nr:C40 family peptidase [Bacteroidales bacterium]